MFNLSPFYMLISFVPSAMTNTRFKEDQVVFRHLSIMTKYMLDIADHFKAE